MITALEEDVAGSETYEGSLVGQVVEETAEDIVGFAKRVGMHVGGEFCKHILYEKQCPKTDLDCFGSKEKSCELAEEYKGVRNTTKYLARQIRKLRDDNGNASEVSQLNYYVGLARKRLNEWKLPNVEIYNKIIIEKLNSI